MCSNTNSGSYGESRKQEEEEDGYFGSCPKKQKKVKVRRRGPGVAELEKIRLQEEMMKSPHSSSSSLPNINHTFLAPRGTVCDLLMLSPNFALHHHHTMNPSPGGFYQFLEPPSNQSSCFDINCNPNSIHSPTLIPSFPRHYPRFMPQYEQQQRQQQQQQQKQRDFDENVQSTSMKPFYNFIPSDQQSNADQEQGASDQYESASDHGIDLSLKL